MSTLPTNEEAVLFWTIDESGHVLKLLPRAGVLGKFQVVHGDIFGMYTEHFWLHAAKEQLRIHNGIGGEIFEGPVKESRLSQLREEFGLPNPDAENLCTS